MLKTGDIVVGRVVDLKNAVVLVEIARIKGHENREIANADQGAIHIQTLRTRTSRSWKLSLASKIS